MGRTHEFALGVRTSDLRRRADPSRSAVYRSRRPSTWRRSPIAPAHRLEALDASLLRELVEAGCAHAGFPAVQEYQALYVFAHMIRQDPPALASAAILDHDPIVERGLRDSQSVLLHIANPSRKLRVMPEPPPPPTPERRPAWRAAALAYRQARRDGSGHDAAMHAAERSLREQWPELCAKEASAEAVAAIANASSQHAAWLWDGVGNTVGRPKLACLF
jgi:hypothetical protein